MPNDISTFDSSQLPHHIDRTNESKLDKKIIEPIDHTGPGYGKDNTLYTDPRLDKISLDSEHFASIHDHFIYDPGSVNYNKKDLVYQDEYLSDMTPNRMMYDEDKLGEKEHDISRKKFIGSATMLNSENNPVKQKIMDNGLNEYDKAKFNNDGVETKDPPLSPIRPFISMDPGTGGSTIDTIHKSIFTSYNRTLLPIADVEFRKGFKHVMFNRPECYIMCHGGQLSEQAKNDPDITSSYSRLPHISKLLSPVYLDPAYFNSNTIMSNWNYLLCNRIINISDDFKTSIGIKENATKSIEQHTVVTGGTLESTQGGTLSITFRDTKNLEVYECLRLWMLYIHKIKKGIFAPSYNGYQYKNDFLKGFSDASQSIDITSENSLHPYDRALDYCASIFQLISNEAMFKIIHWTKWFGVYPIEATINGLSGDHSSMLNGDVTVNAVFRYQKKEVDNNKALVEFNYNAGLCDSLGRPLQKPSTSASNMAVMENENNIKAYVGPSDLFSGTPYIVLAESAFNSINGNTALVPYLKFSGVDDVKINNVINVSLTQRVDASGDALICAL